MFFEMTKTTLTTTKMSCLCLRSIWANDACRWLAYALFRDKTVEQTFAKYLNLLDVFPAVFHNFCC